METIPFDYIAHLLIIISVIFTLYRIFKPKPVKDIVLDRKAFEILYNFLNCVLSLLVVSLLAYVLLIMNKYKVNMIQNLSQIYLEIIPLFIEVLLSGLLTVLLYLISIPGSNFIKVSKNYNSRNTKRK